MSLDGKTWGVSIDGWLYTGLVSDLVRETDYIPVKHMSVKRLRKFGQFYKFDTREIKAPVKELLKEINEVDVKYPIFILHRKYFKWDIVDGNHRLERAGRLGLKTIPVIKVSKELLIMIHRHKLK